jgi:hypothetical protein
MLADFEETLETEGAHAYRRLFWEAGLVGQVLYLEGTHGTRHAQHCTARNNA